MEPNKTNRQQNGCQVNQQSGRHLLWKFCVIQLAPTLIHFDAIGVRMIFHRHAAFIPRLGKFVIEVSEREVFAVILVKVRVVFARRDECNLVRACVVHRGKTHWTWVREDIKLTAERKVLFYSNVVSIKPRTGVNL